MIRELAITGALIWGAPAHTTCPPTPPALPDCRGDFLVMTEADYEDNGVTCNLKPYQQLAIILPDSPDNDEWFHYCYDQGGRILSLDDPKLMLNTDAPLNLCIGLDY